MADILRSRIAPTPSGYLHIGNAYNFLLTEAVVRRADGLLRLRIDDLDALRTREEYLQDIFESLAWLGMHVDEGPQNVTEQEREYSQHLRLPAYDALMKQLVDTGLVFACSCSRKELQQTSEDGQYNGNCLSKNIPLDTPDVAWRIRTPQESALIQFQDTIMGAQHIDLWSVQRHFVIRRRDGVPAYQLASVCDDAAYSITTIVRGEDLLTSTAAQLYLASLLGLSLFAKATFYHHPLITDEHGAKLSKSAGSTSLKGLRASGVGAVELRSNAAAWYNPLL